MKKNAGSGRKQSIGSEFGGPQFWNDLAAAGYIGSIANRAKKNKKASPIKVWIACINLNFSEIGNADSNITNCQSPNLYAFYCLFKKNSINQHCKTWIKK